MPRPTGSRITHGMSTSQAAISWYAMMRRCYIPTGLNYKDYGGRGISVCERWHDLTKFVEDMGHTSKGMQIDRIDVNGNYCPENCRWVTAKVNANNRRNNRYFEYKGAIKTKREWADYAGINYGTFQKRLKCGMSIAEAIETPINIAYRRSSNAKILAT